MKSFLQRARKYALAHKIVSGIVILAVLGVGYYAYAKTHGTSTAPRYVLGIVSKGTIVSSVSASGQISASRQIDIKPEVSGKIIFLGATPGKMVKAGTLLAEIDPTDANKAVRDAQNSLETAKLTLDKLNKPPTDLTMTQAQNSLTNAQDDLTKTYTDSASDVLSTFLDMPDVMSGLQDTVIGTKASNGAQWNIDYYQTATANYDDKAIQYRTDAYNAYIAAKKSYDSTFTDFKTIGNSPGTDDVEKISGETYQMLQLVADALKNMNSFVQFYEDTLKNRNATPSTVADTALTNLNSYITKTNTHLSSLLSDTSSLKTGKQSITEKQQSLAELKDGPDSLDVRNDQLSIQQKQDAVTDAENTLAKYYIRAPFDGVISAVSQYVADNAGSGTAIASMITDDQVATLSLNEVDAAKVKVGNKATLTFDAIDGLSLTGSVSEIDSVGTVSQGVVSYTLKIKLDTQDERVKPGMTVNASIMTDTKTDVLMVPSSAVKTIGGTSLVQVFNPAITATGGSQGVTSTTLPQSIQVETGITDDTNVEIISGLTEGEQIVTRTVTGAATTQTTTGAARTTTGGARGGNAGFGGGGAIRL